MSIIVRTTTQTAPAGASKLYRDALVSDGTLLLHDFSNRGTLDNFALEAGATIRDLSREASVPLGVENLVSFEDPAGDIDGLTAGKGFDATLMTSGGFVFRGIMFPQDLLDYFKANNSNDMIIVVWARVKNELLSTIRYTMNARTTVGGSEVSAIRFFNAGSAKALTLSFGGSGITRSNNEVGDLVQMAVHYRGPGVPVVGYFNNVNVGNSASNAPGFNWTSVNRNLNIGRVETGAGYLVMYRYLIEDLTVSGRSAAEVVRKDWQYCRGIGDFDYIDKRPFIDTL